MPDRLKKIALRAGLTIVPILLLAVVIATFGPLPPRILALTPDAAHLGLAQRFHAEERIRGSILQAVGGVVIVLGAVTAWRQMLIARGQHRLDRRIAVTNAFAKAVEQLSDQSLAVRLGGIYSLDRIIDDDLREQGRVCDILAQHVRELADSEDASSRELDTTLRVLTRREPPGSVELSGIALAGVRLVSAKLAHARLGRTNLSGAMLQAADLRYADLAESDLRGADLADADLREAELSGANLSGARASATTQWPVGFTPVAHGVLIR